MMKRENTLGLSSVRCLLLATLPALVTVGCLANDRGVVHVASSADDDTADMADAVQPDDFSCGGHEAGAPSEARSGDDGAPMKVAGSVVASALSECESGRCDCVKGLALTDDGVEIQVRQRTVPADDHERWRCFDWQCNGEWTRCAAPIHGAAYWMSGTASGVDLRTVEETVDDDTGAGLPWAGAEAVLVDQWCLQTTMAALPGMYTLSVKFLSGGQFLSSGRLVADGDGALRYVIGTVPCDDPNCPNANTVFMGEATVEPGDGIVTWRSTVSHGGPYRTFNGRLKSSGNTLSGEVKLFAIGGTQYVDTGWLRLTRTQ